MLHFHQLPEPLQVLLLAAQPRLPAEAADRLQHLVTSTAEPGGWNSFLAFANHHRLGSLAFHTFQALAITGIPEHVRAELQRYATVNAFDALRTAAEMQRIAQAFASAGLPLTMLKGVTLSQLLYGSPNARNVGDIDLLTAPTRLVEQLELFASLGYDRINPPVALTPRRLASYSRFWKDFTFRHQNFGFELDLHWRLFNHRLHPANRLLEDAPRMSLETLGQTMSVLTPRDLFLYSASHGAADAFTYFKSLADVAGFLRLLTPAELEEALLHAAQTGLLPQVSAAVHLANDWMQTKAQSPHLLPADEPLARALRLRAERMLRLRDFKPDRNDTSPAHWLALEFRFVPGLRSLMELVLRFVWRPRVWSRFNLPDSFFSLYPVLGLLLLPRIHSPAGAFSPAAGHSHAAPRTPLESPKAADKSGVSNSPPKT